MNVRALVMVEIDPYNTEDGWRMRIRWRRRDSVSGEANLSVSEAWSESEALLASLARMKPEDITTLSINGDTRRTRSNTIPADVEVDVSVPFLRELASALEITVCQLLGNGSSASQRIDMDNDDVVSRGVACVAA